MTVGNEGAAGADPQTPLAVFLINLDRSTDRCAAMAEQLRKLGIPFRRVSAVDGEALSEEKLKQSSAPEQIRKNIGRLMARGEIGCCLSHLKIYKIMVEENIPSALILEDDLTLNGDFAEALKGWSRMPGYCRALQLVTTFPITRPEKKRFSSVGNVRFPAGYVAARNHDTIFGTAAYIIRRSYAEELLETAFPVRAPIDTVLFDWRFNLYIPWILYRKRKGRNGEIQAPGAHLENASLLERERERFQQDAPLKSGAGRRPAGPGRRMIAAAKKFSVERALDFYRAFRKYFPLPLNRGRKMSFFDIPSRHSQWRHLQTALSCLAFPGRDRGA